MTYCNLSNFHVRLVFALFVCFTYSPKCIMMQIICLISIYRFNRYLQEHIRYHRFFSYTAVWLVYLGLTPQKHPGSYQGGEMMMMKSVFWWRKPEYPEETTDLRQVTDETFHTYGLCVPLSYTVSGQNLSGQKPIGQYPSGQNPRKTKTQGDKSPGGQRPRRTISKWDKNQGGQKPRGTNPHRDKTPWRTISQGLKREQLMPVQGKVNPADLWSRPTITQEAQMHHSWGNLGILSPWDSVPWDIVLHGFLSL